VFVTLCSVCYRGVTAQRGRIKEASKVAGVFIFSEGLGTCDIPSGCANVMERRGCGGGSVRGFVAVTWTPDSPAPSWTSPIEPRLTLPPPVVNGLLVRP